MRIALDISSTNSDHKFRGIGFYTQHLHTELAGIARKDKNFELIPFTGAGGSRPAPTRVDLYHFPAFSPFFYSFPLRLITKSVLTIHDLIPLEFPDKFPPGFRGKVRWNIQKQALRLVQHIITDSEASKQSIQTILGIPSAKITAIHLAADPAFKPIEDDKALKALRKKYDLPKQFVLYVGDMNWNKNVVNLAKACLKLDYPLVVVGKQALATDIEVMHPWNSELVQFQLITRDNPLQIRCLGYVKTEDLVGIYNLATLLAHPAHAEGFGLPVLEALQSGCPVLTSNRSSLPEITEKAALHINPDNQKELEEGLNKLWEDKALRAKLSKLGIEQAKQFSWEKTAKETVEVYESLL